MRGPIPSTSQQCGDVTVTLDPNVGGEGEAALTLGLLENRRRTAILDAVAQRELLRTLAWSLGHPLTADAVRELGIEPGGTPNALKAAEPTEPAPRSGFSEELEALINRHSREGRSDTPDFILADYLGECLAAYERATRSRDRWHGRVTKIR